MRHPVLALLVVYAAMSACSDVATPPPIEPSESTVSDPIGTPESPEPPQPDEPPTATLCAELRARTLSVIQSPSGGCQNDDDCGCYPAFIDCGGVRDTQSAADLAAIAEQGRAANCGYRGIDGSSFNCTAWECIPRCELGSCLH